MRFSRLIADAVAATSRKSFALKLGITASPHENTPGKCVGASLRLARIGLIVLVDDRCVLRTISACNVPCLVGDPHREPRGLVARVPNDDHRVPLDDGGEPLKAWRRKNVEMNDGDAAPPEISNEVVESDAFRSSRLPRASEERSSESKAWVAAL